MERCADGKDVTAAFIAGARLAASQGESCGLAILKARSPSCGVGRTTIDGQTAPGDGVFAALLKQQGIPSFSNESSADFFLELTKGTP